MKKLIFLLIPILTWSQSEVLTNIDTAQHLMLKAGSCGSPDGSMLEIAAPPADYQELEDNGYCHDGINSTSNVTMCFTFTAGASSILLNAGYSESCANNNFTAFNLYDNTCTLVSTSLSPTGLTVNDTYTWCVTMRAWGGGACSGYDRFCPYWQNNDPLPVELIEIKGGCDKLTWTTASEINSSYFEINYSNDGNVWSSYTTVNAQGNSSNISKYECEIDVQGAQYFSIKEYDFNGNTSILGTVYVDCREDELEIESVYTINGKYLGVKIPEKGGMYVIFYKNNAIGKIIKK